MAGSFFIKNMSFILGKKASMTQLWKDNKVVPVTAVSAFPNKVTLVREKKRDGYEAVQVALGRTRREFRNFPGHPIEMTKFTLGDEVTVASFQEGEKVRVSGLTKGRGFQGVVKRYNFAGGPKTHGQKNRHRAPGSIGSSSFPSRVYPGMRMGGHMGNAQVTVRNLEVIDVDTEDNVLVVKGAVPGPNGGYVVVRRSKR